MRLFALMLLVSGLAAAEDVKIENKLPSKPPASVVLVAQCGHALGLYATMPNGELLAFDGTSGVDFETQMKWAQLARRVVTIEAKCTVEDTETREPV